MTVTTLSNNENLANESSALNHSSHQRNENIRGLSNDNNNNIFFPLRSMSKYKWFVMTAFCTSLFFFMTNYISTIYRHDVKGTHEYDSNSLKEGFDHTYHHEEKILSNEDNFMNVDTLLSSSSSSSHILSKSSCSKDKTYSQKTMKTAFELPFAALFKDTRGEKKFEASSLIKVRNSIIQKL